MRSPKGKVDDLPRDWQFYAEVRDDRLVLFCSQLDREWGTYYFSYLLRPEVEGKVTALPTVVQRMYYPQDRGRSAATTLTVQKGERDN